MHTHDERGQIRLREVGIALCDACDPVEQDGLANAAEAEQELALWSAAVPNPCERYTRMGKDALSARELGRLGSCAGSERVGRLVHPIVGT
jgi:hypothetical protein